METKILKNENQTLLTLNGRLDTVNAVKFQQDIETLDLSDGAEVTVDCEALEYISSSGLRAFISLLKKTQKKGGSVKLLHLTPNVKEVFDMTAFSQLFGLE